MGGASLGERLQICWGEVVAPAIGVNSGSSTTVTLPKPYSNTNYIVSFGCKDDGGYTNHLRQSDYTRTAATLKVTFFNSGNATTGKTTYTYICVGWWK